MTFHKPRKSSGVGITSVSCSIEWLQKLRQLGISPSDAFKRGVKFHINEAENKEPEDELLNKVEKLVNHVGAQANKIEELEKSLELYKKLRGEL